MADAAVPRIHPSGWREVDRDKVGRTPDEQILYEAKERFQRAQEWEGEFRRLFIEDVKFANGDSDNNWQWPDSVLDDRDINDRPSLTVNKTRTILNKLVNGAKQNPPEPRIKPVGGKVSFEAAQVWEGIVRHIMYVSNGQAVIGQAKESQLEGGIGYWLVTHDFIDDRSFDQELLIRPLDPLHVFMDCDIKQVDGNDAMWAFVFEEYNRKEFERLYPQVTLPPPSSPGLSDKDDWVRRDGVRIAEYYRINIKEDELLYIEDENGAQWTGLRSEVPAGTIWRELLTDYEEGRQRGDFKSRKVRNRQLEWYKIAGPEIIERRTDLKGRYVPIVREPGRERRIEDKLYRAGLTRALKDPQRMYNYNTSGEVEVVALQTKTPWVVAAAAIEGNETAWNNANKQNAAYLTYRHKDEDAGDIPPPTRPAAPAPAEGFLEGMRIAAAELEMASGIAQAQQVNPALERTPKAIDERMRTGEAVNYDFTINEMYAVRHTAVIILDLAPHIYNTERVIKIRAKDGTISEINIDPHADEAWKKQPTEEERTIKVLFNPSIGKYAIEADVGPAYQTQRQAAWDAFVQIITHSPELIAQIGDLGFLAADFPMAQEIAERLRRNIEQTMPWLLKDSQIGPIVQNLQQELQKSQQQTAELLEKLAAARIKMRGRDELRDIESFNADTRRMAEEIKAMKELMLTPQQRAQMEHEITMRGHEHVYSTIESANEAAVSEGSPQSEGTGGSGGGASNGSAAPAARKPKFNPESIGAKKAPDGRHYLRDPKRPGKYLMVA
jgi:hypothetical protein